jgi:hypothetical protein
LLTVESKPWRDLMGTYVSVLIPFAGTTVPQVSAEVVPPPNADAPWRISLLWEDGRRDTLHWSEIAAAGDGTTKMLGRLDGFDTDASMLWLCHDPSGGTTGGAALDGTRFRWCDGRNAPVAVAE